MGKKRRKDKNAGAEKREGITLPRKDWRERMEEEEEEGGRGGGEGSPLT
jgi:hypothetical protein